MKTVRWVLAAAIAAVVLAGCSLLFPTKLTLQNTSGVGLEFLEWNGTQFGTVSVWEPLLSRNVRGLNPGYQDTQVVSPGGDYVYFEFPGDVTDYRTVEYVTINRGDDYTFTFYNSTTIVSYDYVEVRNESEIGDTTRRYLVVPSGGDAAQKQEHVLQSTK
jgi:hypothetical protein